MTFRDVLAYGTWPLVMASSVGGAIWGIEAGYDPGTWAFAVSVVNFNVVFLLEYLLPRKLHVSLLRDRQSLNDIGHGVVVAGLARPLAAAFTAGFVGWWAATGIELSGVWPHRLPVVLQVILVLLVASLIGYWRHRFHHTVRFLWSYHALHHSSNQLHVLKGNRLHFGEELLRFMVTPLPLLLLGAPAEIVLWMTLWSNFSGGLAHSNVDQRFPAWFHYVIPTLQVHEIHHSDVVQWQYQNFSPTVCLWDHVFGTYTHPGRVKVESLGIKGDPVPAGFFSQLIQPLHQSWRFLRRSA